MRLILLLSIALMLPGLALAKAEVPTVNPKRTVVIAGVIGGGNILPLGEHLLKLAEQSKEPVDIIISSPGGEVQTGLMFLEYVKAVKARDVKVRCYVAGIAASLAFTIYTQCDERYALESSLLMFHGARIMLGLLPVTQQVAESLAFSLAKLNDKLLKQIHKSFKGSLTTEEVYEAFLAERIWESSDLESATKGRFMKVHGFIPGLLETIGLKDIPVNGPMGQFKPGQLIHITNKKGK
jgi:ATP-dependent protease ClpP protease subunit